MIRRLLAAAALAPLLVAAAPAHRATPVPHADTHALSEHIRVVSGDDFEGRGVSTRAERKTIDYLAHEFAAAGFQPGGPDGGWFQNVALRRFEVTNAAGAIRVGDWRLPLVQGEQAVFSTRLPGRRVDLQNAPLVFVGYGIHAPERNWDDFKGVDLHGKVMVVLVNDADFEEPALNTFGGRAMTYYGRWTYKYEEAARQGAAGVVIVHETGPASYGWNTVRNSWSRPQFDIVRENPAAERVPVEAWIQRDVAVELFRRAGQDFEALKRAARGRDFRPVTLAGAGIDVRFDLDTQDIQSHNVVARLPGRTHPDQTVLYSAHWDHLGMGEPDANGDRIFNGAVDNGTGITGLMELARMFGHAPRTDRSIVLIAFTAEESGLLGSEFYAANPVYPLATTVGGFNMDSLNVVGRARTIADNGGGLSTLGDELRTVAATQGRTVADDPRPEVGGFFRSDHFPLSKRGVPMLTLSGTGRALNPADQARFEAAAADYTAHRYHQAGDEWSADWDLSGMAEDIDALYAVGRSLANSTRWPTWHDGSEFKPAREASASARR